jgi:hypothetical protein
MNGEDPLNGMCEYCWKQMADELEHEMRYEANNIVDNDINYTKVDERLDIQYEEYVYGLNRLTPDERRQMFEIIKE